MKPHLVYTKGETEDGDLFKVTLGFDASS